MKRSIDIFAAIWQALFLTLFVGAFVIGTVVVSCAHEHEQYYAQPEDVKEWLETLMRPDSPTLRCCGEADAYFADSFKVQDDKYVAIITDTREVPGREPRAEGTEIVVPNSQLKFDKGNPTGHGVIFLQPGTNFVFCYVAPGGG